MLSITKLSFTDSDPVILTEPVITWVFDRSLPNIFDPELNITDEDMVCTTNFCTVTVPVNNALDPVISPPTINVSAYDAVCAYEELIALSAFRACDALVAFKAYDALVAFSVYEDDVAFAA